MELLRALLNLMCVSLSMVCKVPQLRFHINSRSTQVDMTSIAYVNGL